MATAAHRVDDDETKARVLRAATALFAERGFHGTKVRDIAARAGANVAAGHYHFGSKRDLYVEVLRACFADVRALLARGGVQPDEAVLDRMSPRALETLMEKRIALMLGNLLGPPPSLHGTLMLREMLDPSDALPIVVAEFIEPMIRETAAIVTRLAPGLDDEQVRWCVTSTMGQAVFYRATLPAALRVFRLTAFTPAYVRRVAAHIADFSIGGIARVAGAAGGRVRIEVLLLLPALIGCGPARVLTQPGGNGGWSPERRAEVLARDAERARVDLSGADGAASGDVATPLALADVVRLAAIESRRVVEADRDVDVAAARVREARGRLFPSISAQGRYSWYTSEQTTSVVLPQAAINALGGMPPDVVIRSQNFGTVNASATVPIDVFGQITKGLTAAQAGYRAEEARRYATLLGEQVTAVQSYFALLEAERLREVAAQTLAAQRQQLTNAESRVNAGRLTKNELLVVQVAVQTTEQTIRFRELQVAQARWGLNQVIGRPVDAPTRIADVTARPALPAASEALRDAYEHNPVLLALVEEQQRLEDTASALSRSRLPQFQGGGTVDYSSSPILQPQQVGGAFVGFNWNFDTGGVKDAQVAQARLAAEQNKTRVERQLRDVEAAVRNTQKAAEERLAALASAETAVRQAEENLRIREQQFDVGRATSENVLDAEALLAEQRATLASALYQAHTRRAELQQVVGLPLDDVLPDQR